MYDFSLGCQRHVALLGRRWHQTAGRRQASRGYAEFSWETFCPGITVDYLYTHYLNTVACQVYPYTPNTVKSSESSGLFQQNNVCCHTAKTVQECFEEHNEDSKFPRLQFD